MFNAADNKTTLVPLLKAMHNFEGPSVKALLQGLIDDHAVAQM
jgi:hypothetical protein